MKLKQTLLLLMMPLVMVSCGGTLVSDISEDFSADLKAFIAYNGFEQAEAEGGLSSEVDLYVDYSTCVSEAMTSDYYRRVHPAIVDSNPNYYSIKGAKITFETNNREKIYNLLNNVREVNYADILGVVQKIVSGDNHAVLITDGEYYQKGIRDNLTNPYLAPAIRTWLQRGLDIYIYSEPYLESGRYNKFRYYIFFTDASVENNIRERFQRSVPEQSNVKMFHLSGKRPQVILAKNYPTVNGSLSLNETLKCAGYGWDVQEYYSEWEDIYNYMLTEAILDGGRLGDEDYLLRGLFVNNSETAGYKVSKLGIRVTNLGEDWMEYMAAIEQNKLNAEMGEPAVELPKVEELMDCELFRYDEKLFAQKGEIALYLNPENSGEGLEADYPNLLKVDIVAEEVVENFSQNNEVNGNFQWGSIAQNGMINTSLYESIRLVLLDPSMNPVRRAEDRILYTIYMSTYSL
uniref:hypothetical protein n=1 Tax=Alistipes sp. TaxID=1872444 RepID=UPI00405630D9